MTTLQHGRSGLIVQGQVSPYSSLPHGHLHAQIEQFRVAVLHFVFAQKRPNHFFATGLERDAQCFVFDVRAQTFGIYFDGCLCNKLSKLIKQALFSLLF